MNENVCVIGRMILTEEYRSSQTDLSLCDYLTKLAQNSLASDSGLQCGRQETNRLERCTAKWRFMCQIVMKTKQLAMQNNIFGPSIGRNKGVCLSVAHNTAEDRYIHKVLNISWHCSSYSWHSFCFNLYNIFLLIFM